MKKFVKKFVTKKTFRFLIAKKIISFLVLVNVASFSILSPQVVSAIPAEVTNLPLPTHDLELQRESEIQTAQDEELSEKQGVFDKLRDSLRKAWEEARENSKEIVFTALIESLDYFANTLAYDTATWLASGGEGQQPMFYTDGWGDYLANLADGAGGQFIESIGKDFLNINVCNPSASLKISIGLGLAQIDRPSKPTCSLSKIIDNFDTLANDPNFLDRVSIVFDPSQNDIGIAASVYGQYFQAKAEIVEEGKLTRQDGPFKSVTSKISGFINTPGRLAEERAKRIEDEAFSLETVKVQFGNIGLTAIQTFINTLAGRLFQKIYKEGLADNSGGSNRFNARDILGGLNLSGLGFNSFNDDLFNEDSSSQGFGGRQTAQLRFIDFFNASSGGKEPYDILTQLTFCPDPENPGPDECAIKPAFRTAVDQRLTVQEAIDAELLDGDAPFGSFNFNSKSIYEGMPYRSIVILRVHRIVPVGWELAAEAIHQFEPDKQYSLNDLISVYNDTTSLYHGLIDPDWVLAAPSHICTAEGFGPQIIFEQNVGGVDGNADGDFNDPTDQQPQRQIGRAEYCADIQTCVKENNDGSCKYYGYCNEERRIWDLQGANCEPAFNTCQTFQNSSGQTASYLANTLDYNGCSLDNAGCRWYCQEFNYVNDIWTCLGEGEDVLKSCTQVGGCNLTASCTLQPGQNVCSDSNTQVSLKLDQACDSGSQFWNGSQCAVQTGCSIPQGGVSCVTNSCNSLENKLSNGDFETAAFNQLAANWNTLNPNYFERVSGGTEKILSGTNSIRFYSVGGGGPLQASSDTITLSPGTYTLSGNVYNSLNSGEIKIIATSTSDILSGGPQVVTSVDKNKWQQLSKDFTVTTEGIVNLIIYIDGVQVNGTAWFDSFKISESCISNSVKLALIGAVDLNESKIHLDGDVVECDAQNDGCSEFIRLQPGLGTNLVKNGNFENWSNAGSPPPGWALGENWSNHGFERIVTSTAPAGETVLKLTNGTSGARAFETSIINEIKPESYYRVSFWAKSDIIAPSDQWYMEILSDSNAGTGGLCSLNPDQSCSGASPCTASDGICLLDYTRLFRNGVKELDLTTQWKKFTFDTAKTRIASFDYKLGFINISNDDSHPIYIDGVQIEEVPINNDLATPYKDYGAANVINLKKPPSYLNCTGNSTTDPAECNDYAFVCEAQEVGCQEYKPLKGGPSVPGVTSITDYCGVECVGYQAYKQSSTFFEDQESLEYFIPATARQCNAAAAGCDEFTNLDEVAAGGEATGYYQYLRQCELPEEANCGNFFSWQGSNETGFQLQVNSLVRDGDGSPKNAISDNLPVAWGNCDDAQDVLVNPFCRELIDIEGNVYYQILDNTVSCSADCHPFRKTNLGESPAIAQVNCDNSNGDWQDGSCVYKAIPQQGLQCNAAEAGCREYKGNNGANVFTVLSDNFEDGDVRNWRLGQISSDALNVGGHSIQAEVYDVAPGIADKRIVTSWGTLKSGVTEVACSDNLPLCNDTIKYNCFDQGIGRCVAIDETTGSTEEKCYVEPGETYCGVADRIMNPDKSYLISFWAKSESVTPVDISITDNSINTISLGPDWNYYTVGPFTYDGALVAPNSRIIFKGAFAPDFWIDNINIQEINGYVYAIRNSWSTPASCDTNPFVDPPVAAPQFMLGCQQYSDQYNRVHNLKSFDYLCREAAVGCEALIDTHNSSDPFAQVFNANDPLSQVDIPQDSLIYLTNRSEFVCNGSAKGCEAVGLPSFDQDLNVTDNQTLYVINDPDQYGTILCESDEVFCEEFQTNNGYAYFKDPRDGTCEYRVVPGKNQFSWFKTGSTSSLPDCPLVQPSLGEPHPADLVGICPGEFNSCTQFIDPTNEVGKSVILNQDFELDIDDNDVPDYWAVDNDATSYSVMTQEIDLEANVAYTLAFRGSAQVLRDGLDQGLKFEIQNCSDIKSFDQSLVESNHCFSQLDGSIDNTQGICSDSDPCNSGYSCVGGLKIPESNYTFDNRKNPFDDDYDDVTDLSIAGFTQDPQYSGRFSVPHNQTCSLAISINLNSADEIYKDLDLPVSGDGIIENRVSKVSVRETGVYYTLSDTVDKASCNGIVDSSAGCVMFNDRSFVNYKISEDDSSYLRFDSDNSNFGTNNGIPVQNCSGTCDANAVLRVQPDRVCESWLYCNSYMQVTDSDGVNKTYCSDLGQCKDINDDGTCKRPILLNNVTESNGDLIDTRLDHYTDREQIKNLSGYVNPGLDFSRELDIIGLQSVASIIRGVFPYAETTQRGSNGKVANGEFEATFGDTSEPVGWTTVDTGMIGVCISTDADYADAGKLCNDKNDIVDNFGNVLVETPEDDCSGDGVCNQTKFVPVEYYDYKFSVQKDFQSSISGAGYLRLNTFHEAVSEDIDVEPNNEYILTAKINTEFLEHPTQDQRAEILLQVVDATGGIINLGSGNTGNELGCNTVLGYSSSDLWSRCNGLMIDKGSPWQDVVFRLDLKALPDNIKPKKMRIKLSNLLFDPVSPDFYNNEETNGCYGYNRHSWDSSCELGGYSLFDSISLKSVLEINNGSLDTNFIGRTCRIYPTGDALSCEFSTGDEFFFGKYGYCLTTDPNNPRQCLQWLPIDQISGETLDEVTSGYNDRFPLYYCTETKQENVQIGQGASLLNFGGSASEFAPTFYTDDGVGVNFEPIEIPDDYRSLLRYPYVQSFKFTGNAFVGGGSGGGGGVGFTLIQADENLTFDIANRRWESYGALSIGLNALSIFAPGIPFGVYLMGFLDIGWDLAVNPVAGLIAMIINNAQIVGFESAPYVLVGPLIGVQIITDQTPDYKQYAEDPVPELEGDIIGIIWFLRDIDVGSSSDIGVAIGGLTGVGDHEDFSIGTATSVQLKLRGSFALNYCNEVVNAVTSSGSNKGYANRLSRGTGYVLTDTISNPPFGPDERDYVYYNPFDYQSFLDFYASYVSSDYAPFGAIVQPANNQFPTAWDSKEGGTRQPLLYEPPRTSFDAPYQARMGEPHTVNGLKQIFAKSYNYWHWEWRNPERIELGGQYRSGSAAGNIDWDVPTLSNQECGASGRYDASGNSIYCFIRPVIDANLVRIDGAESVVIEEGTGTVKTDFNVVVDPDQLPITAYSVDWGDGKNSNISGVVLRNRASVENPFSVFHLYDFWEMVRAFTTGDVDDLNCVDADNDKNYEFCESKIRIKASDNWGVSTDNGSGSEWITTPGTVKVLRP